MLERLRRAGIKTAVVSNKPDEAVRSLAKKYFDGLFDCAVGEQEGVRKKPAPDMTMKTLDELETGPGGSGLYRDSGGYGDGCKFRLAVHQRGMGIQIG